MFRNDAYFLQSPPFVVIATGAILTSLAVTNSVPFQYAAPLEWLGVFCLMGGFTYLCSTWRSAVLASAASLAGAFLDPIFIGGQSMNTWVYANSLVFVFAFSGTCTGALMLKIFSAQKI
jgi:hypothetical protein